MLHDRTTLFFAILFLALSGINYTSLSMEKGSFESKLEESSSDCVRSVKDHLSDWFGWWVKTKDQKRIELEQEGKEFNEEDFSTSDSQVSKMFEGYRDLIALCIVDGEMVTDDETRDMLWGLFTLSSEHKDHLFADIMCVHKGDLLEKFLADLSVLDTTQEFPHYELVNNPLRGEIYPLELAIMVKNINAVVVLITYGAERRVPTRRQPEETRNIFWSGINYLLSRVSPQATYRTLASIGQQYNVDQEFLKFLSTIDQAETDQAARDYVISQSSSSSLNDSVGNNGLIGGFNQEGLSAQHVIEADDYDDQKIEELVKSVVESDESANHKEELANRSADAVSGSFSIIPPVLNVLRTLRNAPTYLFNGRSQCSSIMDISGNSR